MGAEEASKDQQQGPISSMDMSLELGYKQLSPDSMDDDGRPRRTGTLWTASSHIITAVIGSGVLSLAWSIAQLGWIAGPIAMLIFAFVTYYTSSLLADCYRSGDPITGKRNYTYREVVRSNLGGFKVKICSYMQYINLFGTAIGYTVAASISMTAIKRSNCFHKNGEDSPRHTSKTNKALRRWGWDTFGNVFSNMLSAEKEVERLEAAAQNNHATETDLLIAQTKLNKAIDI
ncbi:amino acid permease 5-like [Phalaenopsis equestris]|uniref:amino acid permease 5-like n=1 Tax=Phalaenopsis equestris TaxID=78828 RepID=UPI0009E6386F|nr:amino acid permease 5-like [Phalaenopsis equestris]